jgi:hypothetical protein
MTHRVKCLGKSRSAERAKAREAASNRRAGLVRGGRGWSGGGGASPLSSPGPAVTIMASESFYSDQRAGAPAESREAVPA